MSDDRNWLGAGAPYVRRGPVFDVTEVYWLSGAGGWPEDIYGKPPADNDKGFGSQGMGIQFPPPGGSAPAPTSIPGIP